MKSGIVALFGLTSFLAAALLFSVQPYDRQDGLTRSGRHPRGMDHVFGVLSGHAAGRVSLCTWSESHSRFRVQESWQSLPFRSGGFAGRGLCASADRDWPRSIDEPGSRQPGDHPARGAGCFGRNTLVVGFNDRALAPVLVCAHPASPRSRSVLPVRYASNAGKLDGSASWPIRS